MRDPRWTGTLLFCTISASHSCLSLPLFFFLMSFYHTHAVSAFLSSPSFSAQQPAL